jgi:hypothetical protein
VAVAVNVTGGKPATVAVIVFTPADGPSVQLPTVATPLAFVVAAAPVSEPPPPVTANVTATDASAFPASAITVTPGRTDTACPGAPDCVVDDAAITPAGMVVFGVGCGVVESEPPHESAAPDISVSADTLRSFIRVR